MGLEQRTRPSCHAHRQVNGPFALGRDRFDVACQIPPSMRSLADRFHEQALADADERDLISRTDRRREQNTRETALKDLATRLVALKARQLERMGLGEPIMIAIQLAQAIKSPNARNRQVTVVRQHLRDLGPVVEDIDTRLKALLQGLPLPELAGAAAEESDAAPAAEVLSWSERLIASGDTALEEFLHQYGDAERQQLRQQTRAAVKARRGTDAVALERAETRLRLSLQRCMAANGGAASTSS
jgi:ribosome-associated protein